MTESVFIYLIHLDYNNYKIIEDKLCTVVETTHGLLPIRYMVPGLVISFDPW